MAMRGGETQHGGAGAIGSMPMPGPEPGPEAQRIHHASPLFPERALTAAGLDGRVATAAPGVDPAAAAVFARWLDGAAPPPLHARFSPRPETLSRRAPPMTRP